MMTDWHMVNIITGPCKCGGGHLKSIHMSDGKGRFDTIWSLDCNACRSNYDLVESSLEGNPDKSLAVIKYVPKKVQSLLKKHTDATAAQRTDIAQTATSEDDGESSSL